MVSSIQNAIRELQDKKNLGILWKSPKTRTKTQMKKVEEN